MTIEDVKEIGLRCLVEHEGQVNVRGIRPFSYDARRVRRHLKCDLPSLQSTDGVKQPIEDLLRELAGLGSFYMSEPEHITTDTGELRNISHNDLRMTIWYAMDRDGASHLRIDCYCYPSTFN